MSDVVHIAPGLGPPELESDDCTKGVFVTDSRLSWGPLLPILDASDWKAKRFLFWRRLGYEPDECIELLGDPAELVGVRRFVMWLETSLDSQLTLAWLPAFLRAVGASPERIELVQSPLGSPRLDPFAAHPPPMALSPADLDEVARVWEALVAPEPDALVPTLRSDYEPLPLFKRALRLLLLRYPQKGSGVNASELKVLEQSRKGPVNAARLIGNVLAEHLESPTFCGDDWLYQRLLRLGDPSLPQSALELEGSTEAYRFVSVRLTPFGERVLAGEANFVDANGIDDWVAGVHLDSKAGSVWFRDNGQLIRRP